MSNFSSINDEEIEQDELKTKLDLITVTSSKNLDTMNNSITANGVVGTTNTANFAMTNTSTLRTYAETTRGTVDGLVSLTNTHETEINALQSSPALFSDCIKFTINGGYEYSVGSTNTTSRSSTNPLTTTPRRYVLVRTDTYSSDVVLANDNTTFTPNETGSYLSTISAEFYDNSADAKTPQLELIQLNFDGSVYSESSIQIARGTFVGSSTNYEYGKLQNTMIVTLTAGTTYYYKATGTANGGVINAFQTATNLTLIKLTKSF